MNLTTCKNECTVGDFVHHAEIPDDRPFIYTETQLSLFQVGL